MTYKQLRYQVDCAIASGNKARALEDIKQNIYKTQISDCDHPKTIWITSADTGTKYPIQSCCGECYHCRETKQNEWVTRMWHETKYNSRFCYFITLTYKPHFKYKDIPARFLDAFWHYDDYNETHHQCWSPCLLRLEHLQYFIRNLRNDLESSGRNRHLTFYACGEYGHEYGRPHFHLIVWSQEPITSYDVTRAWSYRKGRKFMCADPIGRIEIDDLNQNGTICKDKSIHLDGKNYSVRNAFQYVAKYVGKFERYNKTRLMYFVESMQNHFDINFFNERCLKYYIKNYNEYVKQHCDDEEVFSLFVSKIKGYFDSPFEKGSFSVGENAYYDALLPFRPFTTCSRSQGIGSIYVKTNIDSLAQGLLRISDPDIQGLVFPSFYLRKTKDYLCGYEFKRRGSCSTSFSKGCRPLILSDFYQLLEDDPFNPSREALREKYCIIREVDFEDSKLLSSILNSYYAIRFPYTGERALFVLRSYGLTDYLFVRFFKFNRHSRKYVFVREISFQEFYEKFELDIKNELDRSIEQQKKAFDALEDRLYCENKINEFTGGQYYNMVDTVQSQMNSEREQMSKQKYDNFSRKEL